MEFTDCADSPTRSGDLLSLQRQRILAAQIKDSELGEDDVLLPTADTFDSAVESVSMHLRDNIFRSVLSLIVAL